MSPKRNSDRPKKTKSPKNGRKFLIGFTWFIPFLLFVISFTALIQERDFELDMKNLKLKVIHSELHSRLQELKMDNHQMKKQLVQKEKELEGYRFNIKGEVEIDGGPNSKEKPVIVHWVIRSKYFKNSGPFEFDFPPLTPEKKLIFEFPNGQYQETIYGTEVEMGELILKEPILYSYKESDVETTEFIPVN
jgi:hypothetical protein